MKQLKTVGNCDWKERKCWSTKALKILKNSKGVSLVELMVTVAIGVFVSMGIASVFVFAMQQFTILVEKNKAEENTLMISYYLRNYLSQAVDTIAVSNVNPSAGSLTNGRGQIDVNFELLVPSRAGITSGNTGRFARFAVFNRESGLFNSNINAMQTGGSDLRPTAIFVKDTDINGSNADAQSGGVVFDYNSDGGAMVPMQDDLWFSRLHNFRIQRVNCNGAANGYAVEVVINSPVYSENGRLIECLPPGWTPGAGRTYKVKTLTIETTMRYFKTAQKDLWNFRVPVGGGARGPYRDIIQTIKINLKNNVLTDESLTGASGIEERVHGSVYFYDFVLPLARNN